jgi:hypothetical protein
VTDRRPPFEVPHMRRHHLAASRAVRVLAAAAVLLVLCTAGGCGSDTPASPAGGAANPGKEAQPPKSIKTRTPP